jgi:hypothetical protein
LITPDFFLYAILFILSFGLLAGMYPGTFYFGIKLHHEGLSGLFETEMACAMAVE